MSSARLANRTRKPHEEYCDGNRDKGRQPPCGDHQCGYRKFTTLLPAVGDLVERDDSEGNAHIQQAQHTRHQRRDRKAVDRQRAHRLSPGKRSRLAVVGHVRYPSRWLAAAAAWLTRTILVATAARMLDEFLEAALLFKQPQRRKKRQTYGEPRIAVATAEATASERLTPLSLPFSKSSPSTAMVFVICARQTTFRPAAAA